MSKTTNTIHCSNIPLIIALLSVALLTLSSNAIAQEKNSTRKIRVKPNEISSRIGTAVNWEIDFDAAMAKSKQTGKPVFWYVPTLRGTFMDRKPVIDRYMLSGPFSWPDITGVINEHYIPIRTAPTREQQRQYELLPYKFVEPGFLVLDSSGEQKSRVDRITTMHPDWFRNLLTRSIDQPTPRQEKSKTLAAAWQQFGARKYAAAIKTLSEVSDAKIEPEEACERELLRGMATFRTGDHVAAKKIWEDAGKSFAILPLGWKCAAEAQGIGPFMRGFEVFGPIPEKAMNAGVDSIGSAAPENTYDEAELWTRSVNYLLDVQDSKGGFTDCDYDFGGTDSLGNVHVAVTSLAGMALLRASSQTALPESVRAKATEATKLAVKFVMDDANVNKVDRDEILWAYAYRLRLLNRVSMHPNAADFITAGDLKAMQKKAVESLQSIQSRGGGWYHEYTNPFVTATALVSLEEAKKAGAAVDNEKVQQGIKALLSDRFANGAYPYDSRGRRGPAAGTNRDISASAGRMPLCELALYHWGQSNDDALENAVTTSLERHNFLDVSYKYDNHTSTLAYGGFFFWYDMRARSETITHIKNEKLRSDFKAQHKALIMKLPEIDGCFVDSHELGRTYGTAMALLSLSNCE